MRRARSPVAAAMAVAVALLVAACRDGADGGAGPTQSETTTTPSQAGPTSAPDDPAEPDPSGSDAPTPRPTATEPDEPGGEQTPSGPREPLPTEPEETREPTPGHTTDGPDDPPNQDDPPDQDGPPDRDDPPDQDGEPDGDGGTGGDQSESPGPPDDIGGPQAPVTFGGTYVWENGLAVTVSGPQAVETTPDSTATTSVGPSDEQATARSTESPAGPAAAEPVPAPEPSSSMEEQSSEVVAVEVTVVNGTRADLNTSLYMVMYSGGDEPAEEYFDSDAGLTGIPSTTLPPGEEISFSLGYVVSDPTDLTLEVWPEYRYLPAYFVGANTG